MPKQARQTAAQLAVGPTPESRADKLKAALAIARKQFGDASLGTIRGENQVDDISVKRFTTTGSLTIDLALGGRGWPHGRIVEIYGHEASGKTTLALHACAEVQRAGGVAAFIDAEHALDPDYAAALGVNLEEMLFAQPQSAEESLDLVETFLRNSAVDLIIVDSVAAMTPRAELDINMGDTLPGLQARLMSQAMRKLTPFVRSSDTLVVFINQTRSKIGVMFGSPNTTAGGNALKFYASIRAEVSRIGALKSGETTIGNKTKIKVVKNKIAPPFKTCEVDIVYGQGLDVKGEMIDLGVTTGIIQKRGSYFKYNDITLAQGRLEAAEVLWGRPDVLEEIRAAVRQSYDPTRIDADAVEASESEA